MFHEGQTLAFESSASANSATPALGRLKLRIQQRSSSASDVQPLCSAKRSSAGFALPTAMTL